MKTPNKDNYTPGKSPVVGSCSNKQGKQVQKMDIINLRVMYILLIIVASLFTGSRIRLGSLFTFSRIRSPAAKINTCHFSCFCVLACQIWKYCYENSFRTRLRRFGMVWKNFYPLKWKFLKMTSFRLRHPPVFVTENYQNCIYSLKSCKMDKKVYINLCNTILYPFAAHLSVLIWFLIIIWVNDVIIPGNRNLTIHGNPFSFGV